MSAGTITLTNKSKVITGINTKFSEELSSGDFIVVTVGGIPYTLPIDAVNNNTSLTLVSEYSGPTQAGAAWYAVPRVALNLVTAELVVRSNEALLGLNYDKSNWQQLFSSNGDIAVKLPDNSQYTGPSWLKLSQALSSKANQEDVDKALLGKLDSNSIASYKGSIGTSTKGGLNNNSATPIIRCGSESFNDSVGFYAYKNSNAATQMTLYVQNSDGVIANFVFNKSGSAYAPGSWVNNSDVRLKTNIQIVSDPLLKMCSIRGVSWDRLDNVSPGIGFIAQSVEKYFEKNVFDGGSRTLADGSAIDNIKSPDTMGVSSALHHEALLSMMSIQRKALLALADPSLSDEERQSIIKGLATLIPDESQYAEQ